MLSVTKPLLGGGGGCALRLQLLLRNASGIRTNKAVRSGACAYSIIHRVCIRMCGTFTRIAVHTRQLFIIIALVFVRFRLPIGNNFLGTCTCCMCVFATRTHTLRTLKYMYTLYVRMYMYVAEWFSLCLFLAGTYQN